MYPVGVGKLFMVQHECTGTGGFDGATERGRAKVTMPGPAASGDVIVRAKRYGVAGNAYTVQFIDAGAGQTRSTTTVQQVGTSILVTLRRNTLAILATADEVAAAINNFSDYNFPVVADPADPISPTVVQAVSATALTGGLDPTTTDHAGLQYRSTFANSNSGVFFFENFTEVVQIRKIQTKFTLAVPAHLKIQTVNLTDGLGLRSGDVGPLVDFDLTVIANDYGVTDIRDPLLPYQGLLVQCLDGSNNPQPGAVKIWVERMGVGLVL